jgi:hypothetical protein
MIRIQHNEIGPGQTWAWAIIQITQDTSWQNLQLEFRWVAGQEGIARNETADQFAKDAAQEDRCTLLNHSRRCTTDAKRKRSNGWFCSKCHAKKYHRLDGQPKPNRIIAKAEKSRVQVESFLNFADRGSKVQTSGMFIFNGI